MPELPFGSLPVPATPVWQLSKRSVEHTLRDAVTV